MCRGTGVNKIVATPRVMEPVGGSVRFTFQQKTVQKTTTVFNQKTPTRKGKQTTIPLRLGVWLLTTNLLCISPFFRIQLSEAEDY